VRPCFAAATAALESPAATPPTQVSADTPEGRLAAGFLAAILEGDRRAACALVLSAVRQGTLTAPDAYTHVLSPALREMGRMWHLGEVNVAEEHFATATALTLMSQVLTLWDHAPANGRTVVSASVEGNTHEIGARMVADFFEAAGWRAITLGASVPAADLACAAADYRADIVALSVMLSSQLPAFRETCRLVRRDAPRARILAGGAGLHDIPGLALENGAHAFARSPAEAVDIAATLFPRP
jgi:methanogenic corrinoid protein MtbC1